jgi:hypothetical protein
MSMPSLETFHRQLRERLPEFPEPHLVTVAKLVNDAVGEASHRHGIWAGDVSTAVAEVVKYLNVADTRQAQAAATEPHLFYTHFGHDGKPAPGARAVPLRLIISVTTPAGRHSSDGHGYGLCFDVIGQHFHYPCYGSSDMATKSMHQDLMERWGALHKPETEPGSEMVSRSDLEATNRHHDEDQAYWKREKNLFLELQKQSVINLVRVQDERDQLRTERDQLLGSLTLTRSERDQARTDLNQLTATYADLCQYIRDIFEQETDEKEDAHRNDTKSMIRYLLVDRVGEQRARARAVVQERDKLKACLINLEGQRDRLIAERNEIRDERDKLQAAAVAAAAQNERGNRIFNNVNDERLKALDQIIKLEAELAQSQANMSTMVAERTTTFNQLVTERDKALEQVRQMEIDHAQAEDQWEATWHDAADYALAKDALAGVRVDPGKDGVVTAGIVKLKAEIRQMEIERDHIAGVDGSDAKAEIAKLKAKHEADFTEVVSRLGGIVLQRTRLEADLKAAVDGAWHILVRVRGKDSSWDHLTTPWIARWVDPKAAVSVKADTRQFQEAVAGAVGACDAVLVASAADPARGVGLNVPCGTEAGEAATPGFAVVGHPDHSRDLSVGGYKGPDGAWHEFQTDRGRRLAELAAKIPADQKGLSLDEINAEVGRPAFRFRPSPPFDLEKENQEILDQLRAGLATHDYLAQVIVNRILGCIPKQFTDRRNPDHLRVVVDLLPIMRMDTSPGGWGEVAAEIDEVTAEKAAKKSEKEAEWSRSMAEQIAAIEPGPPRWVPQPGPKVDP